MNPSLPDPFVPSRARRRRRRSLPGLLVASTTPQQRIVLAVASFVLAAGLTGVGVYATFSTSATATHVASTATVSLALGSTGSVTNRMTIDATGLVPGDTYYRSFDLINNGNRALSSITLTTTASPSSALDTDATNGLQMVLQRCSVAWTESGSSPNFTYTCGGTTQSVLASRAVIGSGLALSNLTATAASTTDHLRLSMTLPSGAGNSFQNLSSTLTFTFNGAQ